MPATDMEIMTKALELENRGSGLGWNWWAVGAGSTRRMTRMVEEGLVEILWKHKGETAYRLTRKGRGLVAVTALERQEAAVPAGTIIEALSLVKGFDDLKDAMAGAIERRRRVHFLMEGPPACAKSLFLTGVQGAVGTEQSYLAFGSRTTAAGLSEVLFHQQPGLLLMDEVDKMPGDAFSVLLGLMETGDLVETKSGVQRGVRLETIVLAACNSSAKLPPEFLSRFALHVRFPPYSREEFLEISEHFLTRSEGCPPDLARAIGMQVFDRDLGDIRKVRGVWELMDEPSVEAMARTVELMDRYSGKPRGKTKQMPAGSPLL